MRRTDTVGVIRENKRPLLKKLDERSSVSGDCCEIQRNQSTLLFQNGVQTTYACGLFVWLLVLFLSNSEKSS